MTAVTHWPHPAAYPDPRLMAECRVERTRGSGPGGQHRNKVETAIRIYHEPTGVMGEASERRSQEQNRRMALQRLRVNLALEVRGKPDPVAMRSATWTNRCRRGRITVSVEHEDFPALLAEALDVLALHHMQVPLAAAELNVTGSQLVRLLQREPRALALVNARRGERNLRPLR